MQIQREDLTSTTVKLTIIASEKEVTDAKKLILLRLGRDVRVAGFRPGKAPLHLLEKQLDPSRTQTEFLEECVNKLYVAALQREDLRPTKSPEITITKFVPFSTLEFTATFEMVGKITLADYKKIRLPFPAVSISAKEIDDVVSNLRMRAATKEAVKRAAKVGDELVIDFTGVDAKTKEAIAGADGKNYALVLGSKTFIPGFEDELVGLKPEEEKTFSLTFPKDYGVKDLQNRKVSFSVVVHTVQKVTLPKLDDAFAGTVGPFKSVAELKADIKRELEAEKQRQARSDYNNQLLEKIAQGTTVAIPKSLIDDELDRMDEEEKRNLVYRGQTWQEHLTHEGLTEEAHREKNRPVAELRVKAGIVLTEVSFRENISVSQNELNKEMDRLMERYKSDPAMQAELQKTDNRNELASRMLSEKTINKLAEYAQAAPSSEHQKA